MPNLINNPNSSVAQNYRRVSTGGSNYGTRRIQLYTIEVTGLSDAVIAELGNWRAINNSEIDADQQAEREFKTATILEAIMRKVQEAAELYIVGNYIVDIIDTDYNNIYLTVGLAGDTFSSGWEMDYRDDPATTRNYNFYLQYQLAASIDAYTNGFWDNVYAYPAELHGDYLDRMGGYALPQPARAALRAAKTAVVEAQGMTGLKNPKRPG